jgi:hypothetical protein
MRMFCPITSLAAVRRRAALLVATLTRNCSGARQAGADSSSGVAEGWEETNLPCSPAFHCRKQWDAAAGERRRLPSPQAPIPSPGPFSLCPAALGPFRARAASEQSPCDRPGSGGGTHTQCHTCLCNGARQMYHSMDGCSERPACYGMASSRLKRGACRVGPAPASWHQRVPGRICHPSLTQAA